VKVVKNKISAPFKKVEFDILYGEGINRVADLLEVASTKGIVEKSGTWFSYKNERLGQGREKAKTFLLDNPKLLKSLANEVYASAGINVPTSAKATDSDASKRESSKEATASSEASRKVSTEAATKKAVATA
jgi:recombination protein RecA